MLSLVPTDLYLSDMILIANQDSRAAYTIKTKLNDVERFIIYK